MSEFFTHEVLQNIWFFVWGLLWAIYFILDGFDLGMGTLLPVLAKNEHDRRVIYNAAGPFWDGNEVWLITAGGVTFAAFPLAYATLFSALYAPLLILLFCLFFRALSFEYRNKINSPVWRKVADISQVLGSFVPALLLGVAFANLFQGIPIDEKGIYHGNILLLLNPYGIAGGLLFVLLFCVHGALFLSLRSVGDIQDRAIAIAKILWPVLTIVAVLFLVGSTKYTQLYANYLETPVLFIIPALAVVSLLAVGFFICKHKPGVAFAASALLLLFVTFFGIIGMYPALIPSNISPEATVTMAKAASSQLTLSIMLAVCAVFVPIVIVYQIWTFYIFSYKLTPKELESEHTY